MLNASTTDWNEINNKDKISVLSVNCAMCDDILCMCVCMHVYKIWILIMMLLYLICLMQMCKRRPMQILIEGENLTNSTQNDSTIYVVWACFWQQALKFVQVYGILISFMVS